MLSGLPALAQEGTLESNKSYWIPAGEIFAFDFLVNRYGRWKYGKEFRVTGGSIRRNLNSSWRIDDDPYGINQLGHPYQGAMYHGFARSAGLNYWQSFLYAFAGSAGWEIAGESTPPSRNDQIASGVGGTFLGEALYRMSSLLLEKHGRGDYTELGAALISPATGFNRIAFRERFSAVFASRNPAYDSRLQFGGLGGTTKTRSDAGLSTRERHDALNAHYSIDYGLPGKNGYHYTRPFDYFAFEASGSTAGKLESAGSVESVMTRGLLFGTDYEVGERYRGIWGLYGSFDYIFPQTYRVSSTALSLGTTGQLHIGHGIDLQGSLLAGIGYTAAGTVRGATDRDYHYGVAPQALASLRLILGNRLSLDISGREYFVSRVADSPIGGHDNIIRAEAGVTLRLRNGHAIALKYLFNRRDATFDAMGDTTQTRGTVGIYYTLLGDGGFGAVPW